MINVDAKIGSKAITLRLQTVLPKIIHYSQHAYVKGRTINDAIRTIDDILEYTERYGLQGKMTAVDFQKALPPLTSVLHLYNGYIRSTTTFQAVYLTMGFQLVPLKYKEE